MKKILDMCCSSRMFWFDKQHPNAVYGDLRIQDYERLCDNRGFELKPEARLDFRELPFKDAIFNLVVFDPPHLHTAGAKSFMAKKYGKLFDTWRDDIKRGFNEGFRVLMADGILIFKWNESQISINDILPLSVKPPLFGHRSGRLSKTHWICFMNTQPSA